MFAPQCLFCDHINPAAAKFCNECGEPLHLKPCKECEAINDRAARICYQCGAPDPTLDTDTAPETIAATPAPEPEPLESAPAIVAATPAPEVPEEAPALVTQTPDATTERRPKHRLAVAALPPLALLGALAVSAYYAYSHPTQLKEWLRAAPATAGGNSGDAPIPAVAGTSGVPPAPAPPVSEGAASLVANTPAAPTAATAQVNDTGTAPGRVDGVRATGVANVDSQAPTPNPTQAAPAPQSQASPPTPAQATPVPQGPRVEKKPPTGGKPAAKAPKKPPPKKKPAPAKKTAPASKASAKPAEAPKTAPGN